MRTADGTSSSAPRGFADWWRQTGERELAQLLYWVWDPIGVNDAFPSTAAEYDRYAIEVATVLASGATAAQLARFLQTIERDRMGISGSATDAVAETLHRWYGRSRATRC